MGRSVGKVTAEISLKLDKLDAKAVEAVSILNHMYTKMTKVSKTETEKQQQYNKLMFAAIAVYAAKAAQSIIVNFKKTITVFAGVEQSLANVKAVTRANAENFAKMEEAARRVGATTRSSAADAAKALYYLGSAGFDAAEAVGALDGVNALAIATNSDLAESTRIVAVTIRQFGLDSTQATDVANTFTAAIHNSLANMDKLGKSFEYAGPIAAGLGRSVEEVTGTLQVLYDKGFSGEKAGRALRRVWIDLADAGSVVNKRLSKMGITFNDVNPTVHSMAEIVDTLNSHYVDATNVASIFGKISGGQMASLLAAGGDAIRDYQEKVTNTSAAFEAMDIQMNTLQGSMDQFKNATEALAISSGKGMTKYLRDIIDTATRLGRSLNKLPESVLAAGTALGAFTGVVTLGTIAIMAFGTAIGVTMLPFLLPIAAGVAAVAAGIVGLGVATGELDKKHMASLNTEYKDLTENTKGTKEETDDLLRSYDKIQNVISSMVMANQSSSLLNLSGSITSATELKKELDKIARSSNLSAKEMIVLISNNKGLNAVYKELIPSVTALYKIDLKTEKQNRTKYNAYKEYMSLMKSGSIQLNQQARLEQARAAAGNEINEQLKTSFSEAIKMSQVLGKSYSINDTLTKAYTESKKKMILAGYLPESEALKDLDKLYIQLQKDYKLSLIDSESATGKRKAILKDLKQSLSLVAEQEKVAAAEGLEFSGATERTGLATKALNDILGLGFKANSREIKWFMDLYGDMLTNTEAEDKAAKKIQETYAAKYRTINSGITDQIKLERIANEKQRITALETIPKTTEGYKAAADAVNAYFDALDKTVTAKDDKQQAAEVQEYIDMLNGLHKTELELIDDERARALAALDGNTDAQEAAEAYYAELVEGEKKAQEEAKKAKIFEERSANIQASTELLSAMGDVYVAYIERKMEADQLAYDKKMELRQADYDAEMDDIDARKEAALLMAEFGVATDRERLQQILAEKQATGDAEAIEAAALALELFDIGKMYDDLSLAQEKTYKEETAALDLAQAKEQADLQYKADKVAWEMNVIQGLANSALAITKAWSEGPWMVAAATIGSAAAMTALYAAEPQKPSFATGGIVPGSSTTGDNVEALVNSGELILNKAQQGSIAGQLGGNDKPIMITINTTLDGKIVASNSAKYFNNGKVVLNR